MPFSRAASLNAQIYAAKAGTFGSAASGGTTFVMQGTTNSGYGPFYQFNVGRYRTIVGTHAADIAVDINNFGINGRDRVAAFPSSVLYLYALLNRLDSQSVGYIFSLNKPRIGPTAPTNWGFPLFVAAVPYRGFGTFDELALTNRRTNVALQPFLGGSKVTAGFIGYLYGVNNSPDPSAAHTMYINANPGFGGSAVGIGEITIGGSIANVEARWRGYLAVANQETRLAGIVPVKNTGQVVVGWTVINGLGVVASPSFDLGYSLQGWENW